MSDSTESTLPEPLQAMVDAYQKLSNLRAANPRVFADLEALMPEFNSALEAAEKYVRTTGDDGGMLKITSTQLGYDPTKLLDIVGEDMFLELGGKKTEKTVYTIDRTLVDMAVATKKLAPDIAEMARTTKYVIQRPAPVQVP